MQSYHSGWYTIFVLNKINLIESFKEYWIDLKDILNFFKAFGNKTSLLGSFGKYNIFFYLIGLYFVLGFHLLTRRLSFSFTRSHLSFSFTRHLSFSFSLTRSLLIRLHSHHLSLKMKMLICFIGVFVQ